MSTAEPEAEGPAPPAAGVRVRPRGGAPQAVVEMERQQLLATIGPMRPQNEEERQGVSPPRKAYSPSLVPPTPAGPRKDGRFESFPGQQRAAARRGLTQS